MSPAAGSALDSKLVYAMRPLTGSAAAEGAAPARQRAPARSHVRCALVMGATLRLGRPPDIGRTPDLTVRERLICEHTFGSAGPGGCGRKASSEDAQLPHPHRRANSNACS